MERLKKSLKFLMIASLILMAIALILNWRMIFNKEDNSKEVDNFIIEPEFKEMIEKEIREKEVEEEVLEETGAKEEPVVEETEEDVVLEEDVKVTEEVVIEEEAVEEVKKEYKQVVTTLFWVGEEANESNNFIANDVSSWDSFWEEHYGGVDDPYDRCGHWPCGFTPGENPFYFALPYNDLDDEGNRKESAKLVSWFSEDSSSPTVLKNKWIEIVYKEKTAYAQWEDVGPFESGDFEYVFGRAKPLNKQGVGAGLDISPAAWDYLELETNDTVSWRFVSEDEVAPGPWLNIITRSGISR